MQIDGWKYYNHAVVPKASPHEEPDMLPVENGDVWKAGGCWQGGRRISIAVMRQIGGM